MANTLGEKELKRKWPVTSGLTGGTEKQEGRVSNLIPETSLVPEKLKKGIDND